MLLVLILFGFCFPGLFAQVHPPMSGSGADSSASKPTPASAPEATPAPRSSDASGQTNVTMAVEDIRTALMPTLATTSSLKSLPLALFEAYANSKEMGTLPVEKYVGTIERIRTELPKARNLGGYYDQLLELSKNEIDDGVSRNIANRLRAALDMNAELARIDRTIEQLKRDQGSSETMASIEARTVAANRATTPKANTPPPSANPGAGGATVVNNPPSTQGESGGSALEPSRITAAVAAAYMVTRYEERRLGSAAKMGINEAKKIQKDIQIRQDFRQFIANLFQNQQFYQAILAADLYQAVYPDGDYPAEMAALYNAALKAMKQSKVELDAFRFKYASNEHAGASERLLAAFMLSQSLPELQTIPREQKRKVSEYLRKMGELESMLMVRDYDASEKMITELKKTASDFDFNKAMAMVNAGRQKSNFTLGLARMMVQQGKIEEAQKYFYAAADIWPNNPELTRASEQFFNKTDQKEQATEEFDKLYMEENWRAIFENKLKFGLALAQDKTRVGKLEEALKKIEGVEMAGVKSEEFRKRGDKYGAWETLEIASKNWPNDLKLNRSLAESVTEAADLAKALKTAREYEQKAQWGSALVWYLEARQIYPLSEYASKGIDTLTARILASTPVSSADSSEGRGMK
ncbi:MAG: hypothetical protein SFY92_09995 [Verrucomicrobiae bacterium]|nr:hypothetical protein [Verrucomicrobiae bacterium]